MKKLILILMMILSGAAAMAAPARVTITGKVTDSASKEPLAGVVLKLGDDYLWAVTGLEGEYEIKDIQPARYTLKLTCLGYVDIESEIDVRSDIDGLDFSMNESSLALDEVVVTAQRPKDGLSTSHTLGRDALNHLQMSNMADMASLLPGGKTVNPDLTASSALTLRAGGSKAGNAAFGTAVEVDGVRVGNNAGFSEMSGVDTRSISVDNIESVEVITGVPSAEYGDLNSGMVKINTKKGRTPYNIVFSVNPRTYQTSVSKGFDLGRNRGVINASGEWARATKKLISPYESYTRRGVSLSYSNTFAGILRFEAGATGNIGGMNSKDDPDAEMGNFTKGRDNVLRANTSMTLLLNKPWITNLKFDASVNYADNRTLTHKFNSSSAVQPSVHSEYEGYYLAERLPLTYYSDQVVDSKELDFAASLKYSWSRHWDEIRSNLKAGLQWKANGNAGEGEYYLDQALAPTGYRPRPYSQYPYMHNLSAYVEEDFALPVGKTKLEITAGLRMENVFVKGTRYDHLTTFSPRFNAKWSFGPHVSVRGGWGITEKLPSFFILYPKQDYRDILSFSVSHGSSTSYSYYTNPFKVLYNEDLRWQRNQNSEVGVDIDAGGFKISLVGFYNKTTLPYRITNVYTPFSYNVMQLPSGYQVGENPEITVDNQTGDVYLRSGSDVVWTPLDVKVTNRTFLKNTKQDNGAPIKRAGVELTVDFPEIKPIKTSFRADASYAYSYTRDESLAYYYQQGWSHTTLQNRSYEYLGIYANGANDTPVVNGRITHNFDGNITSITHIPRARLIITCRLEMSFLTRKRNLSEYGGKPYAFTVEDGGYTATGGNIYDGDSYAAIWPVAYMDLDGNITPFTAEDASKAEFQRLIIKSGNIYTFAQDGYGFYCSANLSVTKEIGKHVSLSFFANNFTNSRRAVHSLSTGVPAILTPDFYYGLTCRLKF
ncbi:MAG: TonB-dependent receptor [Bacteroidales bacterium]|nr:TonB-dependent receptor [Bacteroidales bacterium]